MPNHQDRIDELNRKLEVLLSKQESFAKELMGLYKEIEEVKQLRPEEMSKTEINIEPALEVKKETETIQQPTEEVIKEIAPEPIVVPQPPHRTVAPKVRKPRRQSNLEKFIGENLINKIGIAITENSQSCAFSLFEVKLKFIGCAFFQTSDISKLTAC